MHKRAKKVDADRLNESVTFGKKSERIVVRREFAMNAETAEERKNDVMNIAVEIEDLKISAIETADIEIKVDDLIADDTRSIIVRSRDDLETSVGIPINVKLVTRGETGSDISVN